MAWLGLAAVLAVMLWRTRWRTVGLLIPLLLVIAVGADRMLDAQWLAVELDSSRVATPRDRWGSPRA